LRQNKNKIKTIRINLTIQNRKKNENVNSSIKKSGKYFFSFQFVYYSQHPYLHGARGAPFRSPFSRSSQFIVCRYTFLIGNQDRKAVVTPSRDEAAQARLLDARRVLRIWER